MSRLRLVLMSCVLFSCATNKPSEATLTPVPQSAKPAAEPPAQPIAEIAEPVQVKPELPPTENCQALPAGIKLPSYLSGASVVMIGFLKTCQTQDGREGYLPGSSWTAMGFPCTAGRGRIDKKGSDSVPSVVTFHLQNSCPMQPGRSEDVEGLVRQKLGIPADSHLIAYYPLSVDYWEFADFAEHDIGYRPEFYSPASISTAWQKFSTKGEPIKIRLYGRENAWQPGKKLYEVEAQMVPEGRSSFKLQVQAARSMDDEARLKVKERCEALRPKRGCEEVFGL